MLENNCNILFSPLQFVQIQLSPVQKEAVSFPILLDGGWNTLCCGTESTNVH